MFSRCVVDLITFTSFAARAATSTLDIYFIDVEGGQATLIVTPSHESLLVDAGFPGAGTFTSKPGDPYKARDAVRIASAARAAGIKRIDYLLITHFHSDHDGGVPELAQLIPIRTFIDHGGLQDAGSVPGTVEAFDAYAAVRAKAKHIEVKPGDRLPLKGIEVTVVSSSGVTLSSALPGAGARNAGCAATELPPREGFENPRCTGFRLDFGEFRFADLGDLTGRPLWALFCPNDLLGPLDVYLLPHHGGPDAADPATFGSVKPRAAVINNGVTKGGAPETFAALHSAKGIEEVWQLHRSKNPGAENFADDRLANLDESTSYWIKVSAKSDGSFTVANARTGKTQSYGPHPKRADN